MFTQQQVEAAINVIIAQRDQLTQQLVNQAMKIADLEAKVAELTKSNEAPTE